MFCLCNVIRYLFHLKKTLGDKNNIYNNIKLAIQWDSYNLAKYDIFTGKESLQPNQRSELLELAMLYNKSGFVELLIEHVDLNKFLTFDRLSRLYEKVSNLN